MRGKSERYVRKRKWTAPRSCIASVKLYQVYDLIRVHRKAVSEASSKGRPRKPKGSVELSAVISTFMIGARETTCVLIKYARGRGGLLR